MSQPSFFLPCLVLLLGSAAACTVPTGLDDAPTASTEQAIVAGTTVQAGDLVPRSTVQIMGSGKRCTGVIVSPSHVLTAAHCAFKDGMAYVSFYNGAKPNEARGYSRRVMTITRPAGVTPDHVYDVFGNFADMAILTLDSAIPAGYVPAQLGKPGQYGTASTKWVAGAGDHDGVVNESGEMRWRDAVANSYSDWGGYVEVESAITNDGDSGGPLYEMGDNGRLRLLGVLSGQYTFDDRFTAVTYTPNWIWLTSILGTSP